MARFFNLETITGIANKIWPGHVLARDIPYGEHDKMKLDIFGYKKDELKPVIMFWHGGSWTYGDKRYYEFLANYLQKLGAIVVMVGYPTYPDQKYPGFITDINQAVSTVRKFIHQYGGDKNRIFTMGHSSGAHIAAIATLEDKKKNIAGCITLAVPCTISEKHWKKVFGDAFKTNQQNPIAHIRRGEKRFLLIHGQADRIVRYSDSDVFYKALKQAKYDAELVAIPSIGHTQILLTIVKPFAYRYKVGKKISEFIRED